MALETSSLLVWMLNIPKLCSKVASCAAKLVAATQSLCGRKTKKSGECFRMDNMKFTSIVASLAKFVSLTWACRHCNSTRMLYAWYSPHSWWQVKRHNWEKEIHELLLYNSLAPPEWKIWAILWTYQLVKKPPRTIFFARFWRKRKSRLVPEKRSRRKSNGKMGKN